MLYGIAVPWFIDGLMHYNAQATQLLACPRTETIAGIYGFGYIATGLLALLPLLLILMVIGLAESARVRAQ